VWGWACHTHAARFPPAQWMPEPDWFHWGPSSLFPSPNVASPTTQSCSLWCTHSDNIGTWSPTNNYMSVQLWVIKSRVCKLFKVIN
jgi:hypothetical protein